MRKFKSGAVRSNAGGKISYFGFRHPLCEHSFGKYMLGHQLCEDGTLREPNNWWAGWSEDTSIKSMGRHVTDLECLEAGLFVYKVMIGEDEDTVVLPYAKKGKLPKNWRVVTKEECYNAIRFNSTSGLLKHLTN